VPDRLVRRSRHAAPCRARETPGTLAGAYARSPRDLSVTLFGDNMQTLRKTTEKKNNAAYIMNQGTYLVCTNTKDKHTFRGAAMGTSWEGGKPFVQFLWGAPKEWPCGY
jgi:hypothetical protein